MKEILIIILLTLGPSSIFAQGIFTEKGNTSVDAGVGYMINNDFNSLSYHLGTSIQGVIDVGLNYVGTVPNNIIGNTLYLDYFIIKDSSYGVVFNGASVNLNNASAFLVGFSVYGKLIFANRFPFNIAPYVSLGYLTTMDISLGIGLAMEKKINESFSIILTPTVNSGIRTQIVLGLEFIYQ